MIAIRGYRGDRPTTLGTLRLVDGSVRLHGFAPRDERFIRRFQCIEPGHPSKGRFSIEDGEPWLRALPYNLMGSYTWAEEMPTPPSPSPPPYSQPTLW